jgi:hypothetical protein
MFNREGVEDAEKHNNTVIPANAGVQSYMNWRCVKLWIPAFAG